ncbi:hypothetical protein NECAME_06052 [Necator americanus]|uniref:Uncharacterized protein n=1 Tax=Necator americanus TaxID=51031 RepID=W2TYN4_NECAM|nr:hypothetical protein NECAME_06052 [Necator americanus]ETN86171.1 hypothetical protein NECAME_06052 [Necator americanus]
MLNFDMLFQEITTIDKLFIEKESITRIKYNVMGLTPPVYNAGEGLFSGHPRTEKLVKLVFSPTRIMNIDSFEQLTTRIRCLRVRRCGSMPTFTIIVAYAPTSSCGEEEVEAFYMDLEKFYREDHTLYKIKRVGKEGEGSQKQVQEKREFVKEERAVEEPEKFTRPGESLATAKEIERPKVTAQEQQVSTTREPEKQQRVVKETNIFEKHVSEKEIIESLTTAKEPDGTKVAVQEQQVSAAQEPEKQQRVVKVRQN